MDLLKLQIPLSFIEAQLGRASWRDVEFGLEQELLAPEAVAQLAARQLERGVSSPALVDLVMGHGSAAIRPLVRELAESEPQQEEVRDRWLFLALAWIFERRRELDDPFELVEVAYADFGYPERVAAFVRYMPADEPVRDDAIEGTQGLVEHWRRFLQEERQRLGAGAR